MSREIIDVETTRVDTVTIYINADSAEIARGKGDPPTLMRPTRLVVEWHDTRLIRCVLSGPRVKADGTPFPSGELASGDYVLDDDDSQLLRPWTPQWVVDLTRLHTPPGCTPPVRETFLDQVIKSGATDT